MKKKNILHLQCENHSDPKNFLDLRHGKFDSQQNGVIARAQKYKRQNVAHKQGEAE